MELLDKHFLELEEKARQQIGSIEPLKTDIAIVRGAAPGAGFEPVHRANGTPDLIKGTAAIAISGGSRDGPQCWTKPRPLVR